MYPAFRSTFIDQEIASQALKGSTAASTSSPCSSFTNPTGINLPLLSRQERFSDQPNTGCCDRYYNVSNRSMAYQAYRSLAGSSISGSRSGRSKVERITTPSAVGPGCYDQAARSVFSSQEQHTKPKITKTKRKEQQIFHVPELGIGQTKPTCSRKYNLQKVAKGGKSFDKAQRVMWIEKFEATHEFPSKLTPSISMPAFIAGNRPIN